MRYVEVEGQVEAVVIAKRSADENKVCTLWTSERMRGRGYGMRLLRQAMDWLGDERPLVTVPGERIAEFRPFLTRLGFVETGTVNGVYGDGRVEHVFNGKTVCMGGNDDLCLVRE